MILAFGKPILWLFGPNFDDGYPLMFILAIGFIARAAVGPAERLLNMLGEQRRCALVYAVVFAVNLAGCLAVAGPYGSVGVAIVISTSFVVEFDPAVPDRQAPARPAHADLAAGRGALIPTERSRRRDQLPCGRRSDPSVVRSLRTIAQSRRDCA